MPRQRRHEDAQTTAFVGATDIGGAMAALVARGIRFERYEGLVQDEDGVWTAPSGSLIAWFRDSDGNTLSLQEPAAGE
jgi:hypothetical protein